MFDQWEQCQVYLVLNYNPSQLESMRTKPGSHVQKESPNRERWTDFGAIKLKQEVPRLIDQLFQTQHSRVPDWESNLQSNMTKQP